MAGKRVFVDTACWVGQLSKNDQLHDSAVAVYQHLFSQDYLFTTTSTVINETANALSAQKFRQSVVAFYKRLLASSRVEIIFIDERLWKEGWKLYEERTDKDWSLTDCISIVVMQEKGLVEVLTHDEHFQQAGFKILL
jgi:predicted nucleic acid-binding protein